MDFPRGTPGSNDTAWPAHIRAQQQPVLDNGNSTEGCGQRYDWHQGSQKGQNITKKPLNIYIYKIPSYHFCWKMTWFHVHPILSLTFPPRSQSKQMSKCLLGHVWPFSPYPQTETNAVTSWAAQSRQVGTVLLPCHTHCCCTKAHPWVFFSSPM